MNDILAWVKKNWADIVKFFDKFYGILKGILAD